MGGFAVNNSVTDLWIMLLAGIAGYALKHPDYNVAPLILALVIGPMMENALRQSLMLSPGKFDIFYTQPLCRNLSLLAGIIIDPYVFRLGKRAFHRRNRPGALVMWRLPEPRTVNPGGKRGVRIRHSGKSRNPGVQGIPDLGFRRGDD